MLALRVEFGGERLEEGVEGGLVFGGENRGSRGETVGCGIAADDGLTGLAAGASAEDRVTAIGVDDGWGAHGCCFRLEDSGGEGENRIGRFRKWR